MKFLNLKKKLICFNLKMNPDVESDSDLHNASWQTVVVEVVA